MADIEKRAVTPGLIFSSLNYAVVLPSTADQHVPTSIQQQHVLPRDRPTSLVQLKTLRASVSPYLSYTNKSIDKLIPK